MEWRRCGHMYCTFIAFSLVLSMMPSVASCYGLELPHDAVIVAPFAPIGNYAGHWGVDLSAPAGSDVAAVGAGTVSFAGSIAGRRSVTIDHGGGIRTSYSYLASISVTHGQSLSGRAAVGTAGVHGGMNAFHLSLRIDATYVDPSVLGRCSEVPEPALWLAAPTSGYPVARDRNSRGHVRPTTHRASRRGPGSPRATRSR
jgi:murein DD-endopeptidase MepM/ murein hydrolase activator NlpD